MADNKARKGIRKIQITALLTIVAIIIVALITVDGKISVASIMSNASDNISLSILILLLLYALKSLTIIAPLASLYLAGGILLSPGKAILLNTAGLAITLTVPYILGRLTGEEGMEYLKERYPKVRKLMDYQHRNPMLVSFVSRTIGLLPCDVLSYYFGATDTPYPAYLTSAMGGCLWHLLIYTLLGDAVTRPGSSAFCFLVILRLTISAVSIVTAFILKKRNERSSDN